MLIRITEYQKIDTGKLMDVYSESNYENTGFFSLTKQIKKQPSIRSKQGFRITEERDTEPFFFQVLQIH